MFAVAVALSIPWTTYCDEPQSSTDMPSTSTAPAETTQEEAPAGDSPLAATSSADPLSILDLLAEVPLPQEGQGQLLDEKWTAENLGRPVTSVKRAGGDAAFDVVKEAAIPPGAPLNATLVSRALERLWDTGHYRDIRLWGRKGPGGGIEIVIQASPLLRIGTLVVRGNDALDKDEVGRAIDFSLERHIVPEAEELRRLRRKLLDLYAKKGYRETTAELRLETTKEKGSVALIVDIVEGEPDRYTTILLLGLPEDVPAPLLLRKVDLREGSLRNLAELERARGELVEALAQAGYPDALTKEARERRVGKHEIQLEIDVRPGLLTSFEMSGNERVRSRELLEVLSKEGPVRTAPVALTAHARRLESMLIKEGFLFASVQPRRLCALKQGDFETREAASCPKNALAQVVRFSVEEGPMVEVTALRFHGNTHFDGERLSSETFAFVRERLAVNSVFSPLHTGSLDDVGLSDKRPDGVEKPSQRSAARARRQLRYVPQIYDEATLHLTELYREQGFLSVEVSSRCAAEKLEPLTMDGERYTPVQLRQSGVERGKELPPCIRLGQWRDSLMVDIEIREGVQTVVRELAVEGNRLLGSRKVLRTGDLAIDQPYNEYQLREASKDIQALYQSKGHMFAKVRWRSDLSLDKASARVTIQIEEGPIATVGRIRVDGATVTSRKIIVERLALRPGDTITPKRLESSQDRLLELGVFDSVSVQMDMPDKPAQLKTLRVQVTEGKSQYLEMRAGLATVEGVRGGFEYGFLNIGGWALAARLRARANYRLFFIGTPDFEKRYREDLDNLAKQLEHHFLLGIGQISLPGTRGLLGWAIDGVDERVNEPAFSAKRTTAFVKLTSSPILRGPSKLLLIEARTGIEYSDIDVPSAVLDPRFALYARIPHGRSRFWVTGLKLTVDLRDHPINPTKGAMFWIGGDWVRSIGGFDPIPDAEGNLIERNSNLVRTQATLTGYIPMGRTKTVLSLSGTFGYIFHLTPDSTTWADRYFYVGGIETLRGFPEESLVPEDIYRAWRDSLPHAEPPNALLPYRGGETMFVLRSELRVPIALGFSGALFAEAGNLWRDKTKIRLLDTNTGEIFLRPVAGSGLRYLTPLGPLSFDLGFNLNKRPHEGRAYWYLSVGSAF
ncbi:MAG: BamA/TamA family outer membrane protein [Myxococcota bacterium]|jgi:outer membrane protein assembly factor BamA|nr:BamA/TamA family outer membrane protein [Myxococcota bacterium]